MAALDFEFAYLVLPFLAAWVALSVAINISALLGLGVSAVISRKMVCGKND